jgi:hypothetical protein
MKKNLFAIILMATMLLTFGFANAQSADYFVKNGDLMIQKVNSTSTFQRGGSYPIIDFAEGELNGKNYLIYWKSNGESKICTLREDGSWDKQSSFRCGCGEDREEIEKIKFMNSQFLIITCTGGKRYKKTITPSGGGSEGRY